MSNIPLNSFSILSSCEDDNLEYVAYNCGINLGVDNEILHENIAAIKLEEEARAALAESNYKMHREKVLAENHTL
jgi:hypothetical protein